MRIDVLTLFPEMFAPVLGSSILKRAAEAGEDEPERKKGLEEIASYYVREFAAFRERWFSSPR